MYTRSTISTRGLPAATKVHSDVSKPSTRSSGRKVLGEISANNNNRVVDAGKAKVGKKQQVEAVVVATPELLEAPEHSDDAETTVPSKCLPIDSVDAADPLACVEYVNDIYSYFRRIEYKCCADPTYMSRQQNVNQKMRAILIDWLVEVHLKFKLMPETLFLTVSLIDRFLERKQVARQKLQLVGVTAMLLASKYEEIYFPEVADFVYITDNAYTREEILSMESVMLNILQFNLTVPTANRFLARFVKAGVDQNTKMLASYLIERTLQEYDMLKYSPSMVAASALLISNQVNGRSQYWPAVLSEYTDYKEEDLMSCVADINNLAQSTSSLKSVKKKYSSSKFGRVAYLMTPEEL